jgi:hypothetical protein
MNQLTCGQCGGQLQQGAEVCPSCTARVGAAEPPVGDAFCSACGHANPPLSKFCRACGTPLPPATLVVPTPPRAESHRASPDTEPAGGCDAPLLSAPTVPSRSSNPVALILLALVALAGIGVGALAAGGVFSHSASTRTSTSAASPSPAPASSSPAPASSSPAPASSSSQGFHAPSGNISCAIQSAGAECSVVSANLTFVLPPGGGAAYKTTGLSVPQGAGPVAPYGTNQSAGRITCEIPPSSRPAGITCRNVGTGHGFQASRAAGRQSVY